MQNEKIIKLAEAMKLAGYEIEKIDNLQNINYSHGFGDTKILLSLNPAIKEPLSKEKIMNLFEAFSSNNYGILKYELLFDNSIGFYGNIKLELQSV
jgi:hypothetical protein